MDEYITLADGMKVEPAHILEMSGTDIIVYVNGGVGIDEMYDLFSDPELTERITAERYGTETVYEGYTELYALRIENPGLSTACLRKKVLA